jgi:hypothetical protein
MSSEAKVPRTRRDCSGALTATLTSLIDAGELLYDEAGLIDSHAGVTSFRCLHRRWALDCLAALARGFEPESVSEFLYANLRIPTEHELKQAAPAAVRVMADALEMLRGLRATLDHEAGD